MLIETPKMDSTGSERKDLEQVRSYLFRMVEQLNVTLEGVDRAITVAQDLTAKTSTGGAGGEAEQSYDELKSLIIKTANEIRIEMDVIITELKGTYVAQSDFGTYKEETNRRIEENAKGTTDFYNFEEEMTERTISFESTINKQQEDLGNITLELTETAEDIKNAVRTNEESIEAEQRARQEDIGAANEKIDTLEGKLGDTNNVLNDYKSHTEQYIRTGLLYYEKAIIDGVEVSIPRIGVAIGEDITTITVTNPETGEEEILLNRQGLYTTYTSDKMSFYLNDEEVAYISNGKLYINEAEIFGFKLKMGKWSINTSDNFWNLEWEG